MHVQTWVDSSHTHTHMHVATRRRGVKVCKRDANEEITANYED